jgi:hypothetical protein
MCLLGEFIEVFDSVQSMQDPKIDLSLRDHMIPWQNDPAAADFLSVQILKVNVLKDLSLFSNKLLPAGRHDLLSGASKWQRLVQLCECVWIPSTSVPGLSFVFPATDDGNSISVLSLIFSPRNPQPLPASLFTDTLLTDFD